jgi:IS1 family transposase
MRLQLIVGLGCLVLHDRIVRGVPMALGEVDEVWAYVGRHERRKRATDPATWGDAYTMFCLDAVTKLVPAFLTGRRDPATAAAFMLDLRARVVGKPQLSVDGWLPWLEAVRGAFGPHGCDLGVVIKKYQREGHPDDPTRRHNPGRVKHSEKRAILGTPDMATTSTSLAERANLTTRMGQRRLTRSTNAYSKKAENLRAAIALHFAHYNLVRIHEALGTTPAARAGLVTGPWSLAQLVREAIAVSPAATPADMVADAGGMDDDAPPTERNPRGWRWGE